MKAQHDGTTWRVTRRWVPWRRRTKGVGDAWDLVPSIPAGGADPISGIIALVFLVIFAPVILLALVLTIVAAVEFAVILLLIPVVALGRVFFGRHWIVEVRRGFEPYYEMHAGDWQQSRDRIRRITESISRGDLPPRTLGEGAEPADPSVVE
ncbi:hypothetical protein [Nocardioides silvaticus]|uniref:hypothetical protein n=1 Tax=Nocardioides silvaticus TaxID=2201891 RepID=UPI0011B2209C|nr:hypothetical protein [Nocardioides silvaticus]